MAAIKVPAFLARTMIMRIRPRPMSAKMAKNLSQKNS